MRPLPLLLLLVISTLVVSLSGPASAERANPPGVLGLAIAVSDSDAFIDEWVSTTRTHSPVIRLLRQTRPGIPIYIAFIVSGHVPGADGMANVDVDWVMRRPDGKEDHAMKAYARLRGRKCFGRGFAMADPALTYGFEPTDPVGLWKIEAVAHDRANGTLATAEYVFTLRH